MATVFRFGSLEVTKDIVFGWCLRTDGENWVWLKDLPSEFLEILSREQFPAFVPEDFQLTITSEIERRNKLDDIQRQTAEWLHTKWSEFKQNDNDKKGMIFRLKDRVTLLQQIVEKSKVVHGHIEADLDYVKVFISDSDWHIQSRDTKQVEHFHNLSEMVDRIMARWW